MGSHPPGPLIIRADASPRMGTGHVMRCLSLAHGWRLAGGDAVFVQAETTPALEQRLRSDGFRPERITVGRGREDDVAATVRWARELGAAWVIADGYEFGDAFQRGIKQAGLRLLLFDDNGHASHYSSDLVLNQNLHATPELYRSREPHTRLLLGTRYALLRPQFDAWRGWKRDIPPVARKVLVTLGGADPDNVTGNVIEGIAGLDIEAKIVVGGSNPHLSQLRSQVSGLTPQVSLIVDAPNMPELMAWADVAVAAGGTTSWELAFMGLPSVVLVLADNQRAVAEALDAAGVACKAAAGDAACALAGLLAGVERRSRMSLRARQLVDGAGVGRVVARLRAAQLCLRRAQPQDCRRIWEWANEAETRAVSFTTEPIPWESHVKWFASRLDSSACLFYIAANGDGHDIGQIRFDLAGAEAVVSTGLAREWRGKGLGPALIARGAEQCFADSRVQRIRAYIKPQNTASVRAFEKAGFAHVGESLARGQRALEMQLERESTTLRLNTAAVAGPIDLRTRTIDHIVRHCGSVKADERVLILCNPETRSLAEGFLTRATLVARQAELIEMPLTASHGQEPDDAVAEAMRRSQLTLSLCVYSLAHSQARRNAAGCGGRFLSLPMYSWELLDDDALRIDYFAQRERVEWVAALLGNARRIRVLSDAGTDLTLNTEGRLGNACPGCVEKPGDLGSPPDVEANVAPVEQATQGTIVVDGSITTPELGLLAQPLILRVEHGSVVEVRGGRAEDVTALDRLLQAAGSARRIVGELGVGLNPKACLTGTMLTDEGALGCVHFGLGSNSTIGGANNAGYHLDVVIRSPDLEVDGKRILNKGRMTP